MTPNKLPPLPEKFRKRPVVIEAMQIIANPWPEYVDSMHDFLADCRWHTDQDGIKIETLEGTMRASTGDWIIKGVQGEFYPCKPDIFAATYEPAGTLRQSLPAGAVAAVIADIRSHCNPPNPESDDEVIASYALSWADRLEQSLQADAREKGVAVVTDAMVWRAVNANHGSARVGNLIDDTDPFAVMRTGLVAAIATQPAQASEKDKPAECAEPVAWLHTVTQDDGETDQALSFSPDSFPFDGVGGFRSLSHAPLYTHPQPVTPAGGEVEPFGWWMQCHGTDADFGQFVTDRTFLENMRSHGVVQDVTALYDHPPVADAARKDDAQAD